MKIDMGTSAFLLALSLLTVLPLSSSTLNKGSHLSVENPGDVLVSPNNVFTAGFYAVGDNAYCFAVWFSKPSCSGNNCTIVWMANRDEPVNGRRSRLSLVASGDVVLTDADRFTVWTTNIKSISSTQLDLYDSGNLVLHSSDGTILWQSFDSPTDTLLPEQPLIKKVQLRSARSQSNYSSGFFKLYFDNDNVLRLLFDSPDVSDIYWPDPELLTWENGRSTYNNSRIAVLDSKGNFSSTDDFTFRSADFELSRQRRLTIDFDGNLRLYSRDETEGGRWDVTWQAMSQPCRIHGSCGPNSLCSYVPSSGRKCSCIPGYKVVNPADWYFGCEPEFTLSCNASEVAFLQLTNVEFFGYDFGFYPNYTLERCESLCLEMCDCKGFQFKFIKHDYPSGIPYCYPKTLLLNGHHSPNFQGDLYLKVLKTGLSQYDDSENKASLDCSGGSLKQLNRTYARQNKNGTLEALLLIAIIVGAVEFFIILLVPCFLIITRKNGSAQQGYFLASTGLRRFTYTELKKATQGFSKEIGRGAGGIVYRGILSDNRVAAIKQLYDANQGEAEFLAEISTIGKLNHINLIEMWGYCAEGKHRILVYEYMEHGSLAENLNSKSLDWKKRFDIAVGTAKCMAYLHEECLEWVLHCDVKPQNILLDSNYNPKVSDFGLSRLQNRSGLNNASFSRIRGTRGYMAPEWILNLPITSKVDVYSYGIVVMELVTGKSPATGFNTTESGDGTQHKGMATWVREKMNLAISGSSSIEDITDLKLEGEYDKKTMEILVAVALKCALEDRNSRPTMSQVVEMLVCHENYKQLQSDGNYHMR
ncbi:hypothetical protein HS088_TW11G00719 [Tripterygium wilfordii]|uniref:Receptor-like serine/threonine-protein kinase n=1 Tax=Tripterygium wilfordii TaxID=458696 RepID=A0A7J7D2R8_TRIWF|nr:hypothetical protein HS088_TW11G00719 [Tripterygium wilfordii]